MRSYHGGKEALKKFNRRDNSRHSQFGSIPLENKTSPKTIKERQKRDSEIRSAEARERSEKKRLAAQVRKKLEETYQLALQKRLADEAFEKSILNTPPKKSYLVPGRGEGRHGINLKPESVMDGEHFAQKLGRAFVAEINKEGGESLIPKLKFWANKKIDRSSVSDFYDSRKADFNQLISLIARKAYLDLELEIDGGAYTKLESKISRLSNKIVKKGLPANLEFHFGSIIIRTSKLEDIPLQKNVFLDWKIPGRWKFAGLGAGAAVTLVACVGEAAPTAEVAPLPSEESGATENSSEAVGREEETVEEGVDLSGISGKINPTEVAPTEQAATEVPPTEQPATEASPTEEGLVINYPKNLSGWEIQTDSEGNRKEINKQAPDELERAENSVTRKMPSGVKYELVYLYNPTSGIWGVGAIDEDGNTYGAISSVTELPFAQLTAFRTDSDEYDIVPLVELTKKEIDQGITTGPLNSKDGKSFGVGKFSKDGRLIQAVDMATGRMMEPEVPGSLPEGWQFANGGNNIVNEDGKPLFVYVETSTEAASETTTAENVETGGENTTTGEEVEESPTEESVKKEGEWIRDYELLFDTEGNMDLDRYQENQLTMEDFDGDHIEKFFEAVLKPKSKEQTDWNKVEDWSMNTAGIYVKYWTQAKNNIIKFPDTKKAPFIKDTGFCGELTVGKNKYLYILYELRDVDNQDIEYVNLALALQKDGKILTKDEINEQIRILEEEMNYFPIGIYNPIDTDYIDPLFEPNINEDYDLMVKIWSDIIETDITGDISRIKELRHLFFRTKGIKYTKNDANGTLTNLYK